jgi:hypothetical protein
VIAACLLIYFELINSLSFVVHANLAFRATENPFFHEFLNVIRPSYVPPTRYVLSHSIMDGEAARVQLEDHHRLKALPRLTLLFDGWEDKRRRSLYGSVASQIGEDPIVLSLDDLTGKRGSAQTYLETAVAALKRNELENPTNIIALTTDNPTVMQSFRRKFQDQFFWVLVSGYLESTHPKLILF